MANFETLLSGSSILLFGRVLTDLKIVHKKYKEQPKVVRRSANKFLENNLAQANSKLARIFGYSFEGRYYELYAPAIFLVHGDGRDPEDLRPFDPSGTRRIAHGPGDIDKTGVAYHLGNFALDVRVWVYEKADFSLRLDMSSGMMEEILLFAELDDGDGHVQFGGGKVGGGKVGGGKVGGGKVGGGKVGGGKVGV